MQAISATFFFFPLGNQAIVKGLQDWIVLCPRSKTGHIEHVAGPAPSALDVPLASTSATVVIVRGDTQQAATILLLAWPSSGMAAISAAEVVRRFRERFR